MHSFAALLRAVPVASATDYRTMAAASPDAPCVPSPSREELSETAEALLAVSDFTQLGRVLQDLQPVEYEGVKGLEAAVKRHPNQTVTESFFTT